MTKIWDRIHGDMCCQGEEIKVIKCMIRLRKRENGEKKGLNNL